MNKHWYQDSVPHRNVNSRFHFTWKSWTRPSIFTYNRFGRLQFAQNEIFTESGTKVDCRAFVHLYACWEEFNSGTTEKVCSEFWQGFVGKQPRIKIPSQCRGGTQNYKSYSRRSKHTLLNAYQTTPRSRSAFLREWYVAETEYTLKWTTRKTSETSQQSLNEVNDIF